MNDSLYDDRGRRKHISADERRRFLKAAIAARGRAATLCVVLLFTGARLSEVLKLTPDRIDDETDMIGFVTLKQRLFGNTRPIPIPRDLVLYLDAVHEFRKAKLDLTKAQAPLWTWSRTTAWRRVKKVMLMAGIPAYLCHPHAIRHGFATEADDCGLIDRTIQRLLGHRDIRSTRKYTHGGTRRLRQETSLTWEGMEADLHAALMG